MKVAPMFCVECGREGELYKGLCSDCFLKKNVFVTIPKIIDVNLCMHCGARRKGKGWVLGDEKLIIEEVIRENAKKAMDVTDFDVHISSDVKDEPNVNVKVITHADALGLKAAEEHETKIRFKKTVCNECSKQQGGYWEAKVQFRGSKRGFSQEELNKALDLVDSMANVKEKKDRSSFISKVEKIHNGLDFYLGSKSFGRTLSRELANEFGGEVKESHKLMGKKDGKDVYRTTYSVRTSDYRIGDFLLLEDKVLKVLNISSNRVLLKSLESWEKISLGFNKLNEAKILGGEEIVKDMVVVSKSVMEVQVLDPDTLKTVDVILPENFEVVDEHVKVVKWDESYFLVGED